MTQLSELTPTQGVETAMRIMLEYGWDSNYYKNWQAYAGDNYGDDVDDEYYDPTESTGAWEALLSYTTKSATDGNLRAELVATQSDGLAHDSEVYFVVFKLTDLALGVVRYFKRDGWYASYDGGHLEEGTDSKVLPATKTVTIFQESK